LKSTSASDSYSSFLQLKAKDADDPLVKDARERLAKL